jgi:hypothetical protein
VRSEGCRKRRQTDQNEQYWRQRHTRHDTNIAKEELHGHTIVLGNLIRLEIRRGRRSVDRYSTLSLMAVV